MAVVVAFGGGVNSTALLVGLHERGERPDAICFADTGGERPETHAHVERMQAWCNAAGFPEIVVVRATFQGQPHTLEEHSLRTRTLPSLAYGFKSCSQKFKREPQDMWARRAFPEGEIVKLIGYDAGEPHRAERAPTIQGRFRYRYPLIEWRWAREECMEAIARAGLPPTPKSSCFFCPAMKVHEILALPCDLKERAIAMEENAELTTVAGLGRRFAWKDIIRADSIQGKFFPETEIACECYDGSDDA